MKVLLKKGCLKMINVFVWINHWTIIHVTLKYLMFLKMKICNCTLFINCSYLWKRNRWLFHPLVNHFSDTRPNSLNYIYVLIPRLILKQYWTNRKEILMWKLCSFGSLKIHVLLQKHLLWRLVHSYWNTID